MLKQLIKSTLRNLQNKYYHRSYDNSQESNILWDGSKESLVLLCEYLLLNIIELSKRKKSFLVQPPIFQKSVHKSKVEKAETFARSFIGAAYYLKSNADTQVAKTKNYRKVLEFYRKGTIASYSQNSNDYWGINKHIIIENTSIIIGLILTESILWNKYSESEKEVIVTYISSYLDMRIYDNNWIWFKIFHYLFLEKYNNKNFENEIKSLLNKVKGMLLSNGWYKDGIDGKANIDYYSGWAFHYYYAVFKKYASKKYLEYLHYFEEYSEKFSKSYMNFFIPNGTHPIYGRSQVYRFASLAPFGYFIENKYYNNGELKYLKSAFMSEINIFLQNGMLSNDGYLTMGIKKPAVYSLEHYSGSASPYWAMKAFSLLLVEDENIFWNTKEQDYITKNEIHTINENKQILTYNLNGRIFLFDGYNINQAYGLKYNKFIYKNISTSDKTKEINWFENSISLYKNNIKLTNVNIIDSKVQKEKGFVKWSFDEYQNLRIESFYIMLIDGYIFHHKFYSSIDQIKCDMYGLEVLNNTGISIEVLNSNVSEIQKSQDKKVNVVSFNFKIEGFIIGISLEQNSDKYINIRKLANEYNFKEEQFFNE